MHTILSRFCTYNRHRTSNCKINHTTNIMPQPFNTIQWKKLTFQTLGQMWTDEIGDVVVDFELCQNKIKQKTANYQLHLGFEIFGKAIPKKWTEMLADTDVTWHRLGQLPSTEHQVKMLENWEYKTLYHEMLMHNKSNLHSKMQNQAWTKYDGKTYHWGEPHEPTVVKMAPTRPLASTSFCLLVLLCERRSLSNLQQRNTKAWYTLHQNNRLVSVLVSVQWSPKDSPRDDGREICPK